MARRLKVFQARLGFYDSVVAAPSRPAALRAWGVRQDLFASGEAGETADAAAIEAAVAHPGTPLQRAVGTDGPFAPQPRDMPRLSDAPPKATPRKAAAKPAAPPPDRRALDAAEAALRDLEAARAAEEAQLRLRQEALDEEKRQAQRAHVESRRKAAADLEAARAAFRRAGGEA